MFVAPVAECSSSTPGGSASVQTLTSISERPNTHFDQSSATKMSGPALRDRHHPATAMLWKPHGISCTDEGAMQRRHEEKMGLIVAETE